MTERPFEREWVPPVEIEPDPVAPMELPPERARPVPPEERRAEIHATPEGEEPATSGIPAPPEEPVRRSRVGRWLAGAVGALVVVALGFDTADLLERSFAVSTALGALVAGLVTVAAGAAVKMVWDELRSLKRLRRIDEMRRDAERLTLDSQHGAADSYAGRLARFYDGRPDLDAPLARLRDALTDAHDDAEVVRLVDREVLAGIDRRAYQAVLRASRDTAVATALSPAAAIDIAVVMWRNTKLVREIAALYGARPGYIGSLRLLRRMLANLAVAGVTEGAHHVAVEALGGSLAAAISTRVGQGVINGLLTARVGITAMHLCRPISFGPQNRPSLGRIRAELLSLPKQVL